MAENHQFASFDPRPVSVAEALRALGLLALLLLAFYWKLTLTGQYTWLNSPDLANQVLPWLQYQAGEIHQYRVPLWGMFEWGGQSLIGQAQPGTAYPPNWLMLGLRFDHGWIRPGVLNGYYFSIHLAAAFFLWRLCRDIGCSFLSSILGGFAFGAGGFVESIDWPQMVNGAVWAPLIFMYHLRSVDFTVPFFWSRPRSWTSAALAGLFLGLSWLAGHHQVPLFLSIAIITSGIYFSVRSFRSGLRLLVTLGIAGLLGSLQILPAMEYGRLARRWVGLADPVDWAQAVPYFLHEQYSFIPQSIIGVILPGLAANASAFFGVAIVVLALWGAVRSPSAARGEDSPDHPLRAYWTFVTLGGLLLALAQYGGVHGLLYALLPGVEKARSPSMAVAIFSLGICTLAALGCDRLRRLDFPSPKWPIVLGVSGGVLGAGLWLANLVRGHFPDQRLVLSGMAALAVAAAVNRPRGWIVLAVSAYLELGLVATQSWPNVHDPAPVSYLKPLAQHGDVAAFLASQPQPVRVFVDDQAIPYNFGDWHGIEVWGGYLASLSQNILDTDFGSPAMRRMMAVTHSVGRKPIEEGGRLVFEGKAGVNVYALPDPLPRAQIVHRVFAAPELDDAKRLLRISRFDFRQGAVLEKPPTDLENCNGGRAAVLLRQSGRMVVAAEAPCRSLLVVAETAAPGWELRVDGRPAPILTANIVERAAIAEPGWHVYEFLYRPVSVGLGALAAILGVAAVVFISIMEPRWE